MAGKEMTKVTEATEMTQVADVGISEGDGPVVTSTKDQGSGFSDSKFSLYVYIYRHQLVILLYYKCDILLYIRVAKDL